MKKTTLFLAMMLISHGLLYSQTYSAGPNVYTCKGGVIATLIANSELNSTDLADTNFQFFNPSGYYYHLGLTTSNIIGGYTAYYNCHAYAWHITEGNTNNVWINAGLNASNISTYWSGSYSCFAACPQVTATKIHYYSGDHSAVKSTVAGKYESKFGAWYLMRHHPDSVPYSNPGNRNYYVKGAPTITISGPTSVSVSILGQSNGDMYQAITTTNYGQTPITSYEWSMSPMSQSSLFDYGYWANIYFNPAGDYQISCRATNSYGTGPWATFYVGASRAPSQLPAYNVYPNPVRNILYIDIPQTISHSVTPQQYDIRLYDMQGNVVINTITTQTGTVQIDVSNLRNGTYLLQIFDGVNPLPYSQIVVKQ